MALLIKRLYVSRSARAAFADRLHTIMDERGLNPLELAQRMRAHIPDGEVVTQKSIMHYLRGRALPRRRYFDVLCLALGVDASALIPDVDLSAPGGAVRPGRTQEPGMLRIVGVGDQVDLWIEKRVPHDVALQVMEALKATAPPRGRVSDTPLMRAYGSARFHFRRK